MPAVATERAIEQVAEASTAGVTAQQIGLAGDPQTGTGSSRPTAGPGWVTEQLACPAGFDPLDLHRLDPGRYPFLLESVAHGTAQGRYDLVFAFPGDEIRGQAGPADTTAPFLPRLDAALAAASLPSPPAPDLPFRGGWFLYLGYELRSETEPGARPPAVGGGPVAVAVRIPAAVLRDRLTGTLWLVAEAGSEACLVEMRRDLGRLPAPAASRPGPLADDLREPDPAAFLAAVATTRDLIARGDLYQANLSRRWHGQLVAGVAPWEVYARLRATNPAPFAGLAVWPGFALASSSPERLVQVTGTAIETRPIAGTRPVAGGSAADRRRELLDSAKERAEHVMLIDLERNDLGRICQPGSVAVRDFMVIESYAHVHHIVSGVRGTLRPGVSPGDILRAVFPGGTITGCPKVRCMAVIDELEAAPRGAYTGSMGYLNRDGSCDLNILIRTIELRGDQLSFAAGSGIVADSDPWHELEETRAKARGMVLAVGAP
jgi:anthranilate synthase component 1